MPKDKAPDGMPTETIRRFIETSKRDLREWQGVLKRHEESVRSARSMIAYHTEKEVEYEEWLEKRLEAEREANPS